MSYPVLDVDSCVRLAVDFLQSTLQDGGHDLVDALYPGALIFWGDHYAHRGTREFPTRVG